MKPSLLNNHSGIALTAPKQGDRLEKPRDAAYIEAKNVRKRVCLSCKRRKCRGCQGKTLDELKRYAEGKL